VERDEIARAHSQAQDRRQEQESVLLRTDPVSIRQVPEEDGDDRGTDFTPGNGLHGLAIDYRPTTPGRPLSAGEAAASCHRDPGVGNGRV